MRPRIEPGDPEPRAEPLPEHARRAQAERLLAAW
jgi:hypothetical protein